jgi:hypothetical protein
MGGKGIASEVLAEEQARDSDAIDIRSSAILWAEYFIHEISKDGDYSDTYNRCKNAMEYVRQAVSRKPNGTLSHETAKQINALLAGSNWRAHASSADGLAVLATQYALESIDNPGAARVHLQALVSHLEDK